MDVLTAIQSRASTRAFLDRPVDRATITAILDTARWSPSGANTQPWEVCAVTGTTRQRITEALLAAREAGLAPDPDYAYYPAEWVDPFKTRRVECGMALYGAQGIKREDRERRIEAWNDNYRFFGAPAGLLVFIDRRMEKGSWVDLGMFVQSIMLAALGHGLATCPQAALAEYPNHVRNILGVDDNLALVCGLSLGYPDPKAPVNNYRTTREPVDGFTRWYD